MMNSDQRELVRAIVFETVERECPDQLNQLRGVWYAMEAQSRSGPLPLAMAGGLDVLGDVDNDVAIKNFMGLIFVFVGSLPVPHEIPSEEQLYKGLRSAGLEWGLKGKRLEKAVNMGMSRTLDVMQWMSASGDNQPKPRPATHYWLASWRAGKLQGPKAVGTSRPSSTLYEGVVDLIIDEPGGTCTGSHGPLAISELTMREQVGLWLALTYTGREFHLDDVKGYLGYKGTEDARRKYPMIANQVCERLIGRRVLPQARGGYYRVPANAWSWTWIMCSEHFENSRLLAHA